MDWSDPVDLYCERLAPGLWAEPLNACSNVAFLLAGWWAWRASSRHGQRDRAVTALALVTFGIGLASLSFHTVAERWAEALDVGAIGVFMVAYPAIWLRRVRRLPWRAAWLGAPAFAVFAAGIAALLHALAWAVPAAYVAALLALGGLALGARRASPRAMRWLGAALALFCGSLALRQLDLPLCAQWHWGTHWAWHVLNAAVLWAAMRAVQRR